MINLQSDESAMGSPSGPFAQDIFMKHLKKSLLVTLKE